MVRTTTTPQYKSDETLLKVSVQDKSGKK